MSDQIKCPHCGGLSSMASDNRWRPFCSERCLLIDLGDWIDGGHRIATDEPVNTDFLTVGAQTEH